MEVQSPPGTLTPCQAVEVCAVIADSYGLLSAEQKSRFDDVFVKVQPHPFSWDDSGQRPRLCPHRLAHGKSDAGDGCIRMQEIVDHFFASFIFLF